MRFTLFVVSIVVSELMFQCHSQPPPYDSNNDILYYFNEVNVDSYTFKYETRDVFREESGGFENGVWTVRGKVTWYPSPGALTIHYYKADANGYEANFVKIIPSPQSGVPSSSYGAPALSPNLIRGLQGGALISKPPKPSKSGPK